MRGGLRALLWMILAAAFCAPPAFARPRALRAVPAPAVFEATRETPRIDGKRRLCAAVVGARERTERAVSEPLAPASVSAPARQAALRSPCPGSPRTATRSDARLCRAASPRAPPAA